MDDNFQPRINSIDSIIKRVYDNFEFVVEHSGDGNQGGSHALQMHLARVS
jgi:hypothetical protein